MVIDKRPGNAVAHYQCEIVLVVFLFFVYFGLNIQLKRKDFVSIALEYSGDLRISVNFYEYYLVHDCQLLVCYAEVPLIRDSLSINCVDSGTVASICMRNACIHSSLVLIYSSIIQLSKTGTKGSSDLWGRICVSSHILGHPRLLIHGRLTRIIFPFRSTGITTCGFCLRGLLDRTQHLDR